MEKLREVKEHGDKGDLKAVGKQLVKHAETLMAKKEEKGRKLKSLGGSKDSNEKVAKDNCTVPALTSSLEQAL